MKNIFKKKSPDKTDKIKSDDGKKIQTRYDSLTILADKNYFLFFEGLTFIYLAVIFIICWLVVSISTSRPNVKFFATDKHGVVQSVHNIGNDVDINSNATVQEFILSAIPESFTFDFNSYKYILSKNIPKYFTKDASTQVKKILASDYIPSLTSKKEFFNISIVSSFVIIQGMQFGKNTNEWKVLVPAKLSINNGRETSNNQLKIQLTITRNNTTRNDYGLQISSIKIRNDRA